VETLGNCSLVLSLPPPLNPALVSYFSYGNLRVAISKRVMTIGRYARVPNRYFCYRIQTEGLTLMRSRNSIDLTVGLLYYHN